MNTYEKLVWMAERAKCGFYLTHNEHKDLYESVSEYITARMLKDDVARGGLEEMIKRDEIWSLQVYPRTPIGFYRVLHWNLEELVDKMYNTVCDELKENNLPTKN